MSNTPQGHYDRSAANVTANKTLTSADSGIVQNVVTDGVTVTLPSTTLAANFTIRNGGQYDGKVGFTVATQAADGITGNGFTAAVGKGAVNTKATSKTGDEITLSGTGAAGTGGYVVTNVQGTFARVA
jgi:hypothetical protein